MSSRFDLIAQQLFQKPFADCTIQELEQFTKAQPYLAPAQFLLAKKMLQNQMPEARAQVQKAALYYHQPAAFDAFLNADFPELETFYKEEATETAAEEELQMHINLGLPTTEAVAVPDVEPETTTISNVTEAVPTENLPHLATEPAVETATEQDAPLVAVNEKESEPAPEPLVREEAGLPAFEPYHTIDYFASQGIRLSQEEATKDKMGRQLKSFTQWLKTMKRLPATEQLNTLDPHAEQKVEHLAAHSVAETEIVTEAMAEVWIKQGNLDKAAAVYHKLSLSNPSKRAYFAAKLESLKKNV